ncbi:hypothetical protein CY34DRAFT_16819 [Suillus luteus UH-Slu-Lm8-n1]|uniref:Secreted protein n=1 Tax=Suillus luteus UH-Slu-Lm8-n1 TaxID=930992 RepID=A0A0D0AV44_9AGAM|nr:hypothetical protein CY34DRAFT_16819 [Suillus luteus UH-Slu-Lm8-n1]
MPLCLELILVIVYGFAEAFYTKSLGHNGAIMNNTRDLKQLHESHNEKDGDEELENQAHVQDNDPHLFPDLIDEEHFTGPQRLEPDLDDRLTDNENPTHPQHSDRDSGTSAEGRNENGDPLPLDIDEEVLMNEVYEKAGHIRHSDRLHM